MSRLPKHEIRGSGNTTVFLFHGAYGSGAYFGKTVDAINDAGYRTVVWDAPGYGGTELPEEFSIENLGKAAARLIDEVGTEQNVLLGHSMGSLISPFAAMKATRPISAIILSGASAGFNNRSPEDQERFVRERLAPITEEGKTVADYSPELLTTMMAPGASGSRVDRVREVVTQMSTDTFVAALRALTMYSGEEALAAIEAPTYIISGNHDTACPPAGARQLQSKIGDAELTVIEDAGHYAFAETPEEFERLVLEFLGSTMNRNG